MKTLDALFSTLIFALLFVALAYFTQEIWNNITLISTITGDLTTTLIIIFGYCLISGFLISLTLFKKKEAHNLKDIFKGTLFIWLVIGLFIGLMGGAIIWFIYGLFIGPACALMCKLMGKS